MSTTTEDVIRNHLAAARVGVDAIMQDYTDDSVLIAQDATYHGLAEIRGFFTALLDGLPERFFDVFKLNRQEVMGEWAYILWEARPWYPLATDTFVVRNGKIRFQTFTAYRVPRGES